jgi:3-oxoacyl-[acyl-carrier protein] reductase
MKSIDLSGRVALVTGAGGDLGRAMARMLATCGADVAVHYRGNREMAQQLVTEITAMGRRAVAVQAEIGDEVSVNAMGAAVRAALGDPDIVVTNAVTQIQPWSSVLEESIADYESQFRSSVLQNVLCAKAFVPAMRARGWGRLIGINTECTMQCRPRQSAYVAGKGGMDRLMRVLAREVGPFGITVNQVAPGWTISDRYRKDGVEVDPDAAYTQALPLQRRTRDEDIAHAVCFLASDLACAITGVYLPVCSGAVMPAV